MTEILFWNQSSHACDQSKELPRYLLKISRGGNQLSEGIDGVPTDLPMIFGMRVWGNMSE